MDGLLAGTLDIIGVSDDVKRIFLFVILRLMAELDSAADPFYGTEHAIRVYNRCILRENGLSQRSKVVLRLAALLRDLRVSRDPGAVERAKTVTSLLATTLPNLANAICATIACTSISVEAGNGYTGEKWDPMRWIMFLARSDNIGGELPRVHHIVSAANVLEWLSTGCHWSTVEIEAHALGIDQNADNPHEVMLDLVRNVHLSHITRSVKLANWIHDPDALPEVESRIKELVSTHNEWASNMGAPDTLLIRWPM